GYQKLYLYSWPKPSGLHWRWHLFTGQRDWMQRPWREGWYGSGADYNVNPVMGWGDSPGATTDELVHALAKFDPHGLSRALGRDEDHTAWFAAACDALLPGYMYSLDMEKPAAGGLRDTPPVPVIPVRAGLPAYDGPDIGWPPGWAGLWTRAHVMPAPKIRIAREQEEQER
ncbi:MAG: L-asparaginase, partial [Telluria sp.]